jgi:hypothetical protein
MASTTLVFHNSTFRILSTLLLAGLLAFGSYTAQALDLEWAKSAGGIHLDQGHGVAVDSAGNTYVTGEFINSATFGSGEAGETTFTHADAHHTFLAKYSVNGDLVWVKQLGGIDRLTLGKLTLDDTGNIYATGSFDSEFVGPFQREDFDSGAALFVAKYTANGDLVWSKSVVGDHGEIGASDFVVDNLGNVYVTGTIRNTSVTFGLGETGEARITSGAFVVKYNSTDGSLVWAKHTNGDITGIALDNSGGFYITGFFSALLETNSSTRVVNILVARYTADGNLVWAKRKLSTGRSTGRPELSSDIAVDGFGNVYIAGHINKGTITFSPFESGEISLTNDDETQDIYIVKYAVDGNLVWAKDINGKDNVVSLGISRLAVSDSGNAYVTGRILGNLVFGTEETSETSETTLSDSVIHIYVAQFTTDGNLISAQYAGGGSSIFSNDIAVNDSGTAYVTGFFDGTATFGAGETSETTLINEGDRDIFVAKYTSAPVPPITPGITPVVVESQIAASTDDAEEIIASGTVNTGSRDLEMAEKNNKGRIVGIRFNGLNIPKDATITEAYLQFQVNDSNSERADLIIAGQAADNAPTFIDANANISSRIQTDASVEWTPEPWNTLGEAGSDQKTPNIASVIQEIVSQEGWSSGNSLAIIITGAGMRSAESFNGSSAAAPLLHVEYTIGAGTNQLLAVEAGPDQRIVFPDDVNQVDANLDGSTIIDNDQPSRPMVTTTWSKQSGPGIVTFDNPDAVDTTVNFSVVGIYKLRLTADNGAFSDFDELTVTVFPAQTSTVLWVKRAVGTRLATDSFEFDFGLESNSIAVDGLGNTYITGYFEGRAIFGSGEAQETMLTSDGDKDGAYDIFVAKYTADGNLIWARRAGGINRDEGYSIAVDDSGNAYVTGYFAVSATFGVGETSEITLTSISTSDFIRDIFVAKYTTDGDLVWAKQAGGKGEDYARSIAVDDSGNAYVTGHHAVNATFGSGEAGETLITQIRGIFVAKYATSGNLIWVKHAAGKNGQSYSLAVDDSGNAYITGFFQGTETFGIGETNETTLTGINHSFELFLAKYTINGDLLWAKRAGGEGDDVGNSVAVDGSGNAYITGYFREFATFGSGEAGETTLNDIFSVGSIFMAKYTADGRIVWAQHAGGSDFSSGQSIALDDSGIIYVTGSFDEAATFGPGETGETIFTTTTKNTGGNSIAVDDLGNAYITGTFYTTAIFGSEERGEITLTSDTNDVFQDTFVFIAKYSSTPAPVSSPGITEMRIAASSDDAEENTATGEVKPSSSDLELGNQNQKNQLVGMRFKDLNIPQGATITNASIQFQTDETHSGVTSLMIEGEATDNALTFTNVNANISSRTLTSAIIDWAPAPWTTEGEAGAAQQTPNIAPIIQEIVERPGWSSGNSLVVIISGNCQRNAESFHGDPVGAPVLHVEYQ